MPLIWLLIVILLLIAIFGGAFLNGWVFLLLIIAFVLIVLGVARRPRA